MCFHLSLSSNELPFDIHGCGYQTMSATDTWTEAEDRLHFFTEECDQLQVKGKETKFFS